MNTHKIILEKSNSVTTEANGLIGVNPNKPEYGSIQMATTTFDFSGFAAPKRTVHFMSGRVEDLKTIISTFDLAVGDNFSEKVQPSRLIVKESTTPFYDGQQAKINPSTGEEITYRGESVYRETDVVPADSAELDSKLSNDRAAVTATSTASPFVGDAEELTA